MFWRKSGHRKIIINSYPFNGAIDFKLTAKFGLCRIIILKQKGFNYQMWTRSEKNQDKYSPLVPQTESWRHPPEHWGHYGGPLTWNKQEGWAQSFSPFEENGVKKVTNSQSFSSVSTSPCRLSIFSLLWIQKRKWWRPTAEPPTAEHQHRADIIPHLVSCLLPACTCADVLGSCLV